MANHKSAEKAIRKIETRTELNRTRKNRVRSFVKKVDVAVAGTDKKAALVALREAESEIMRAVSKGVLKKNSGARKVSRLAAKVKALA